MKGPARLLFAGSTGVWLVNLDGTGLRRLHKRSVEELAISSDGRRIAFVVGLAGGLWVAEVDAEQPRLIHKSDLTGPSFTPDGHTLAVARATGDGVAPYAINVDGSGLRKLAAVEASQVLVHPAGKEVAIVSRTGVDTVPMTGGLPTRRLAVQGSIRELSYSPDGERMAFTYEDSPGEVVVTDIFVSDINGDDRLRLTRTGDASSPSWSPDGAQILFHRSFLEGEAAYEAWAVKTDGTTLRRLIPTDAHRAKFSPDAKHLVYLDGTFGLNVARPDGSRAKSLFRRGDVLVFGFVAGKS